MFRVLIIIAIIMLVAAAGFIACAYLFAWGFVELFKDGAKPPFIKRGKK